MLAAFYSELLVENDKLDGGYSGIPCPEYRLVRRGLAADQNSAEEKVAAEICSMDDMARPSARCCPYTVPPNSATAWPRPLGQRTAEAEVERALGELRFSADETRPYALRRLRARIEANLSGLLGPAVAHRIIERRFRSCPACTPHRGHAPHRAKPGRAQPHLPGWLLIWTNCAATTGRRWTNCLSASARSARTARC